MKTEQYVNGIVVTCTVKALDNVLNKIEYLEHLYARVSSFEQVEVSKALIKLDKLYVDIAKTLPETDDCYDDDPDYLPGDTLKDRVAFHREELEIIETLIV